MNSGALVGVPDNRCAYSETCPGEWLLFLAYTGILVIGVRRFVLSVLLVVSSVIAGVGLAPSAQAADVGLSDPQTGRIANEDPANWTPHILNGTVYSIVQVGDQIVVGGTFTQVRTATSSTVITRNRVFAFNATTGAINNSFNPSPNGTVYKVQQTSRPPTTVYVGGAFTSAAGGPMPGRICSG